MESDEEFYDAEDEEINNGTEEIAYEDLKLDDLPSVLDAEKSLDKDLEEVRLIERLFLNGEFLKAEAIMKPKFKKSLYITHAYGVLMLIKAFMTFDPVDISNCLELIKASIMVASFYRKKDFSLLASVSNFVKGVSFSTMNKLQRHAELIYAEAFLMKALLAIVTDENLYSFVQEGISVRASYLTYKQCDKWLSKVSASATSKSNRNLKVTENYEHDPDFVSGVKLGLGTFSLILSLLPSKFLRIIEIIGFGNSKNNRKKGLEMLQDENSNNGIRKFMMDMGVMTYYVIISSYVVFVDPDFDLVDSMIARDLQLYPKGPLYLFFAARSRHARGKSNNLEEAISYYKAAIDSQTDWIQLHHICYWETSLCYALSLRFTDAANCIRKLLKESKWSKSVYSYTLGMYLYMAKILKQTTEENDLEIDERFKDVPNLMQRIAGRRIPLEKFVSRKARKYFLQGKRLWYPAFEFLLYWNGFKLMDVKVLGVILELSNTDMKSMLQQTSEKSDTFYDDYCLAALVKGVCLREMKRLDEAVDTIVNECLAYNPFLPNKKTKGEIKLDHYLIPYGYYELGRTYMRYSEDSQKREKAKQCFERAKNGGGDTTGYKKYSLENALHLRVHNALDYIKNLNDTGYASHDESSQSEVE